MRSITEATNLRGKYVLVRSSCNVPLVDGKVTNAFRLKQALPTLQYLSKVGARTIVLGHIGRESTDSLLPVLDAFKSLIQIEWGGNIMDDDFADRRNAMADGDILLVENIRQDKREAGNDSEFAAKIALYGDIYVNDAFDNIHRAHASMVALPKLLPVYAGLTLLNEVTHIEKVMTPKIPSLFILGGAKFETKMPLLHKYIEQYGSVFVGGALANDIILGLGFEVGRSLRSEVSLEDSPLLRNPKLILPVDVVVQDEIGEKRVCGIEEVRLTEMIVDMGPQTVASLESYIKNAQTVLWNGPLGLYEEGGDGSTHTVAKLIAKSGAYSVLGGGDTVAAVEELGLNDEFGFVSTGGGAMLTLLEDGTTKALVAIGYKS
ncbi:MAG: phosphoglycerate kinase [Candidatus Paceibacteria bacterium]